MKRPEDDHLLDVREAAAILDLTPSTLYQWAYERRIAYVKLGGALRFRRSAIERLIDLSEVRPLRASEPLKDSSDDSC
jgi:excisionase family DNA binding protein